MPTDTHIARLFAVALEGAARGIRSEFLTQAQPVVAEEPAVEAPEAPAVEAPRYTKKRTLVRIKKVDRREVACADGVSRRWYSGHAHRTAMRKLLAKGQVEAIYWADAVRGLGEEVAHRYYGERNPDGVFMSEREFLLYAREHRPKGAGERRTKVTKQTSFATPATLDKLLFA